MRFLKILMFSFLIFLNHSNIYAKINPAIIAEIESSNNPKAFNARTKAYGLFQLTPIAVKHYDSVNHTRTSLESLFQPEVNRRIGEWYLSWLASKCDSDREVLISYNYGFRHRKDKIIPKETREYLEKYRNLNEKSS